MYHEQTTADLRRMRRRWAIALVALALVAALAAVFLRGARANAREQGAAAMRESILAAATRCCAVEGSYPASVEYLEQRYGLRVNHDDYTIIYEAFASNVLPSVVVVPR